MLARYTHDTPNFKNTKPIEVSRFANQWQVTMVTYNGKQQYLQITQTRVKPVKIKLPQTYRPNGEIGKRPKPQWSYEHGKRTRTIVMIPIDVVHELMTKWEQGS